MSVDRNALTTLLRLVVQLVPAVVQQLIRFDWQRVARSVCGSRTCWDTVYTCLSLSSLARLCTKSVCYNKLKNFVNCSCFWWNILSPCVVVLVLNTCSEKFQPFRVQLWLTLLAYYAEQGLWNRRASYPSVCPSHHSHAAAAGLLLWAQPQEIDCRTAPSIKRGQYCVFNRRRTLNIDLFLGISKI